MEKIHLQSVGKVPAIAAGELKVGDVRMYNFGSTATVVRVYPKTEKTITVVIYDKENNKFYLDNIRKTTLVAVVKRDQDVSEMNPEFVQDTSRRPFKQIKLADFEEKLGIKQEVKPEATNETITVSNEESKELEVKFVKGSATKEEEKTLVAYHLQLQEQAMTYKKSLPKDIENCITDDQMYKVVSTFNKNNDVGIFEIEITGAELKHSLWRETDILNIITALDHPQEQKQETPEVAALAASYTLNNDKNGIEIKFESKPCSEVLEQLKANGFRWSRHNRVWYNRQSEDSLEFAESLCNAATLQGNDANNNDNITEYTYPDIDIYDVHTYTVTKELQSAEYNASWIFRNGETDKTKEIQDHFSQYNRIVSEILITTDNEQIRYHLKKAVQSYKKKYYNNYVTRLRHKASNPSWFVTGRDGRNARRDQQANNREDRLMQEAVELTNEIDAAIDRAKRQIRKDNQTRLHEQMNNTTLNIEFITETKEITFHGITERVRTYNYQDYMICKSWGTFRIFKSGKEIYSMKTTQKLDDAKKYIAMLVEQQEQKAV